MVDLGDSRRTMAAHLAHLAEVGDDARDADDVVLRRAQLALESAPSVGKSSSVLGAEMFCWIIIMPHERWNMRSEKLPCSRVTWL